MAKKKRNPQDATLRNVRAAKKRRVALEARVLALEVRADVFTRDLEKDLDRLSDYLSDVDSRLSDLENGRNS
jgi:hypothetical protein